jgi:D-alanyl-D-alanine carboxypeptidase
MRTLAVASVVLAVFLSARDAYSDVSTTPSAMSAKAKALVDALVQADQFSGTVLVAQNGVPVFRQAFGLANREWGIPNVPEAKFRIASITKEFTATAILQLAEAGMLSIDDPVSKYYTDAPVTWKDITLRHLLTHTSGIPSYTSLPQFFDEDAKVDRTPDEIIKLTRDKPLEFEPGTKFTYDNTGYIILGYIIEKVSGERYADYIQHHIFQPLGMKSSGYDSTEAILPQRASGYRWEKTEFVNADYLSMSLPFSAGSLYSTIDDLLIWDQALYAGKLLNGTSFKAMFTDYGHGYGFGWFINKLFGHNLISHSGGINGFVSMFERFPDDKLTVIVLSNENNAPVGRLADGLAALYLGVPPRSAIPGGEKIVRDQIDQLRQGTVNYDQLSADLADETRKQLPALQKRINDLGPVASVSLIAADPVGADRYKVRFKNGVVEWLIAIGQDGKIIGLGIHPLP